MRVAGQLQCGAAPRHPIRELRLMREKKRKYLGSSGQRFRELRPLVVKLIRNQIRQPRNHQGRSFYRHDAVSVVEHLDI